MASATTIGFEQIYGWYYTYGKVCLRKFIEKVKTPLGIRIVVCSVQREGHLLTLFAFRLIISASLTRGEIRYAVDGLYDRTVLYST